jgi:hypothetical protein
LNRKCPPQVHVVIFCEVVESLGGPVKLEEVGHLWGGGVLDICFGSLVPFSAIMK